MDTAGAVTGIMTDRTTTIAMAGAAGSGTVTADFMAATTDTATEPDSQRKIGNDFSGGVTRASLSIQENATPSISEIEAIAENHLSDQMICRVCHADT